MLGDLFKFRYWRDGHLNELPMIPQSSTASDLHRYDLYFVESDGLDIPAVGDSIRFNPGIATDLSGAHPHDLNPWVRIVGEQKLRFPLLRLFQ